MHLGGKQERGSRIDKVTNLHHMLLLAKATGIGTDRAGIFEIHLHLLQWLAWRKRLVLPMNQ